MHSPVAEPQHEQQDQSHLTSEHVRGSERGHAEEGDKPNLLAAKVIADPSPEETHGDHGYGKDPHDQTDIPLTLSGQENWKDGSYSIERSRQEKVAATPQHEVGCPELRLFFSLIQFSSLIAGTVVDIIVSQSRNLYNCSKRLELYVYIKIVIFIEREVLIKKNYWKSILESLG